MFKATLTLVSLVGFFALSYAHGVEVSAAKDLQATRWVISMSRSYYAESDVKRSDAACRCVRTWKRAGISIPSQGGWALF